MKQQAMNPFLPLFEYVPDGEPRIFGDRIYLYGSHDQASGEQFCVNDYVVWSAPLNDLSDWVYEGISYTYQQTGTSRSDGGNLAAPDCVQGTDGRYYLYYNRGAKNSCEVAVSETPAGPFSFLANVCFPDQSEPEGKQFDPGVLVDDDGRVYLFTGFVPTPDSPWIHIAGRYSLGFELEADMHTIKSGPVEVLPGCLAAKATEFEGHGFYEASSPRKINGRYYLVYSSEQSHDLCYAVSDQPLTGYRYGGILVSNADIGLNGNTVAKAPYGNTHGGLVCIAQQWYIFYHRQTHGIECCRQSCAEPIAFDQAGAFHQAEITSCGLNGGALRGMGTYNVAYACNLIPKDGNRTRLTIRQCVRGVQPHIFEEPVGGAEETQALHYIANMQDQTIAGFKYFSLGEAKNIRVRLSASLKGKLEVYLDEACDRIAAKIAFEATEQWQEFCAPFQAPTGVFPLFFKLKTSGSVDWMEFTLY